MVELETAVSPEEFTEWMAFYQLEPFGTPLTDDYWRTLNSITYSANSKPGTAIPDFFRRDVEERERMRREHEGNLDSKLRRFFDLKSDTAN